MSGTEKTTFLPHPKTHNYLPDRMGFGATSLVSIGGGFYRGYQLWQCTGGCSSEWWTLGAFTALFATSVFGLVRTQQHKNVVYAPLTEVRVVGTQEVPDLTALQEEIDRTFTNLGLRDTPSLIEKPEEKSLRRAKAILLHYSQKIEVLEPLQQKVQTLENSVGGKETEIRQLKSSKLTEANTKVQRLERDLKEAQNNLAAEKEEVERLQKLIDLNETSDVFYESQIKELRKLVTGLAEIGPQSPNREKIEGLFNNLENLPRSRNISAVSSPIKSNTEQKKK